MSDALVGEQVKISSFGTFSCAINPPVLAATRKTGEEVPINPRRVLTFRPSHLMKDRVAPGTSPDLMSKSPTPFAPSPKSRLAGYSGPCVAVLGKQVHQVKPSNGPVGGAITALSTCIAGRHQKLLHDDGLTIKGVQKSVCAKRAWPMCPSLSHRSG